MNDSDADIAVIDIGAGSVRLAVYIGGRRHPLTRLNDKASCGLGSYTPDGCIRPEAELTAIRALQRFAAVLARFPNIRIHAVATAGLRDAADGPAVLKRLETALGHPIRLLSGEDEGMLAADGVRCVLPEAQGMIADLGSGSLELAEVHPDVRADLPPPVSFPLGVLSLRDRFGPLKRDGDAAIAAISEQLQHLPRDTERVFLIGGSWRALAAAYREHVAYPLRILHGYTPPSEPFIAFARALAGRSAKFCAALPGVPKKRAETLPYAAAAAAAMLDRLRPREIFISAAGIREGVFYRALPETLRCRDPLFSAAEDMEHRSARFPGFGAAAASALAERVSPDERRLWHFTARTADVAGLLHPDNRAEAAALTVLFGPFYGLSHRELLIAAAAVAKRCDRNFDLKLLPAMSLLSEDDEACAKRFTALLREAHAADGGCPATIASAG